MTTNRYSTPGRRLRLLPLTAGILLALKAAAGVPPRSDPIAPSIGASARGSAVDRLSNDGPLSVLGIAIGLVGLGLCFRDQWALDERERQRPLADVVRRPMTEPTPAEWTLRAVSPDLALAELARFYAAEAVKPECHSDEAVLKQVTETFWPTNCFAFAAAAMAIIAPACARRPHLTRKLIRYPIEAWVAGGLAQSEYVIPLGLACTTGPDASVKPSPEGERWLRMEWPKLGPLAQEVFAEVWKEMMEETEDSDAQAMAQAPANTPSPPAAT